jgi:hypothetical protein
MRARITLADATFGNKLVIEALAARNPVCNSPCGAAVHAVGTSESVRVGRYAIVLVLLLAGSDRQIMSRLPRGSLRLQVCRPGRRALAARCSTDHADSDRETGRGAMRAATCPPTRSPGAPDPVAEPFGHPMPVAAAHQP